MKSKINPLLFFAFLFILVFISSCAKKEIVIKTTQSASTPIFPNKEEQSPTSPGNSPPSSEIKETSSGYVNYFGSSLQEEKIEQIRYCPTDYALSYRAGSCNISEGKIKFTFKIHSSGVKGLAFFIAEGSGRTITLKETSQIEKDKWQSYVFLIPQIEEQLGGEIKRVIVMPIKEEDGKEKVCLNQQLIVMVDKVCKI
ncbi:MAG: hypothetical protein QXG86_02840 [Candidatus Woesearchaeota archaeon]